MGNTYIPIADILRAAGLVVNENADTNGWQNRSRSSGGFPGMPLGVQWHHTASSTAPENDVHYQVYGQDNPIGNVLLDRNGCYWPIAGGAANTAGKGGPLTLSRGTIAQDNANATTFAIEAANNGVGEIWPQVQIDAYFAGSNALNAYFGNLPSDVFSHALGAGDGWTNRKIDPATCNVEGPWVPTSVNSSGTWSLADIRAECMARAGGGYAPPQPQPPQPVPPATDDWWTAVMYWLPVLTPGGQGIQVLRMQHLMCAVGAMNEQNTANYDGVFGNGTANALNAFKVSAGGSADSTCDGWTWGALMHTIDGIPNLKKGDSGADVKRMQHLLAANGYMNPANMSNYDGQWGNGTDNAKANFDRDHGLGGSDTSCGSKSWESLLGGTIW
jgi:peptidoglycan hydrolase-like protein with peptidoglycan-binding domain